jgi:hypothetical protein
LRLGPITSKKALFMKNIRTELKWGLIFLAMQLVWMAGEKWAGLHGPLIEKHAVYTNLIALPSVLIYILALRDKRIKDYGGSMTYRQGFLTGLLLTAVVTLLSPVMIWLTVQVISPDFFVHFRDFAVASEQMTPEQAAAYFSLQSYMIQAAFGAAAMGTVTSALVALITKKKAPNGQNT